MSIRKKIIQEARAYLRENHNLVVISLDEIKGVSDRELENFPDLYVNRIIDDTVMWEDLG